MKLKLAQRGISSRDPLLSRSADEPPRRRGRLLAFVSMALLAGMVGGLAWLGGPELGSLELLPPEPTLEAETVQAATNTPAVTPSPAPEADAAIPGQPAGTPVAGPNPARLRDVDLRTVVAPPSPTPTRTPVPPVAAVDAVVGAGGATLWDAASGAVVAQVAQGELLSASIRSGDGAWLYVTTSQGRSGWVQVEQVIIFDSDRLRVEDVEIAVSPSMPPAAGAMSWLTPTPVGDSSEQALPAADAPTARVAVDDARLNIRSGPGSDAPILAKADPGDVLVVRGRSAAGDWLQVLLPDGSGVYGWLATEFVELSVPLSSLPVVDGTGPDAGAPLPAGEGAVSQGKGGEDRPGVTQPQPIVLQPTPVPVVYPTAAPKPAAAAQPPASGLQGKLAIQTTWGGDIYLYDLATGELRHLTGGFDPAISPDGQQVAFTRAGGEHGLYLINVDGSNERLIFSGRELLRSPKWSPDGSYIVFERGDEVIVCLDVGSNRCIPRPPGVGSADENVRTERQQKLARVDVNGQNYRDLAVLERARVPDWNAAGVVYQSPAGIQITQDDPNAETRLVFFNIQKQYELDPDWQPNGGRIIFQRREADHWEIYSVNPDGSGLVALTRPGFTLVDQMPSNVAPAWSPDGRHIVFLSNRLPDHNAGPWAVWVMDADGSNPHRLPLDLDFTYTYVAEQMLDWGR